ncbi:GxxExxY protein [Arundinibacter roseus]|nr:GxxExxY protein [Arundinibacter roseus]
MTKKEVTQLSYDIVGASIQVHKELGPGLMENINYQQFKTNG